MPPWGREEVVFPVEGLEAIRLADYQGLDQETAAGMMNVSRQTFGKILAEARDVVADALIVGKILRIEGEDDIAVGGAVDFREKEGFHRPGFDGTGPMGAGPMIGGARGFCNPAFAGYGPVYGGGFGYGRSYGQGRGFRRGFGPGFGWGRGYGRGFGWRAFDLIIFLKLR
jgi:predicted DNA-binding protein (UPF0251 family)